MDASAHREVTVTLPESELAGQRLPLPGTEMFVGLQVNEGEVVLSREFDDVMPSKWFFSSIDVRAEETGRQILAKLAEPNER